jgi:hypothetical protein
MSDQNKTTADKFGPHDGETTLLAGITGVKLSYVPGDIVGGDHQLAKLLGHGGAGAVFACRGVVTYEKVIDPQYWPMFPAMIHPDRMPTKKGPKI